MKLKLCEQNSEKIEAALKQANGSAHEHVWKLYQEIEAIAKGAEEKLAAVVFKKDFNGARFEDTSGESVASSYKYARKATHVTLERGTKDWFLVEVKQVKIFTDGPKTARLILTAKQVAAAVAKLLKLFSVGYPHDYRDEVYKQRVVSHVEKALQTKIQQGG